jgi:hypothetical protein
MSSMRRIFIIIIIVDYYCGVAWVVVLDDRGQPLVGVDRRSIAIIVRRGVSFDGSIRVESSRSDSRLLLLLLLK